MVKKIFRAITAQISGLHEAAFWLASFSILSQILAFIRDRLLAHYFGAGEALDIYYTAFRVPDFIFVTLGSLVSISVLVPMFSKKAIHHESAMKTYINSIFTSFFGLMIISCTVALIFMPQIAGSLFKGFDSETLSQIVKFSRILLLSPLLLGLSNFFGSIVQYEKRFLLYSLSPLFYNIGIIAGTFLGAAEFGVIAVVLGVVLGAFIHFSIPAVYIFFWGKMPKFTICINWQEVKETALISIPRALALSVTQIINIAFTAIASFFGAGAIAVFNLGLNLQSMPLSIVGASYSLAAFPTLSEHHVRKNIEECGRYVGESLRFIIFWTLPLSALFIILRTHIVRVVLGSGAFNWVDTRLTAAVLALFALSFVFQSIQLFLTRTHYALGKTKVPLLLGFTGAVITIFLTTLFYFGGFSSLIIWLQDFLDITGLQNAKIIILPLSFSLGSLFITIGLWLFLNKDTKKIAQKELLKSSLQSILSSLIIGLVTFYALRIFDNFFPLDSLLNVFSHALTAGIFGLVCGAIFLKLVKNKELAEIITKIPMKNPKVSP
ncbi:MAG: oligosaccharide flippase family protein [Candidatus Zambryskibacteria bacterium]|nr:oligosaccharide flippase family protein [Candidatus Zambryskibacteria bacterium]